MSKQHLVILCGLLALGLVASCDNSDDPEPVVRNGLELLEVPATLLANIDSVYTIRARVTDEGVAPETIRCMVTLPDNSQQEFALYDDGGLNELPSHAFAGSPSGDIAPGNGTYTRTINGKLLAQQLAGDYLFVFDIPGQSDPIYSQQTTIAAANINDCVLESIPPATDLVGCYNPLVQSVELARTEPDEIEALRAILLLNGGELDTVNFTLGVTDTIWDATITPSTFPCAGTGDGYSLRYEAETYYGLACMSVTADFSILNDDPELFADVGLPDTIRRPTALGDTDTVAVSVRLDDCNLLGLLGFNGVRFDVSVDGGPFGSGEDFFFNDAGVSGDTIAGNGVYTVGLAFWRDDLHFDNEYILRYYAVECAPPYFQTEYIYDTVRVIQQDGDGIMLPVPADERGFAVVSVPELYSNAIVGSRR